MTASSTNLVELSSVQLSSMQQTLNVDVSKVEQVFRNFKEQLSNLKLMVFDSNALEQMVRQSQVFIEYIKAREAYDLNSDDDDAKARIAAAKAAVADQIIGMEELAERMRKPLPKSKPLEDSLLVPANEDKFKAMNAILDKRRKREEIVRAQFVCQFGKFLQNLLMIPSVARFCSEVFQ